jgi:predicted nucleotidyltransferase component of viral defense system
MIEIHLKGYDAGIAEKVTRLIELLSELDRHPFLSKRVCLHGGTAINLFMQKAPRLSVDADITYVGSADKQIADAERPVVENAIQEVGTFLGYNVTTGVGAVAGRTFRLRYDGIRGGDYIKIDINYLNRIPLFPVMYSECMLDHDVRIVTFSHEELIGGKTKALFDRVTMRDIYDISRLYRAIDELFDMRDKNTARKLRRTILFYAALSNLFPADFSGLTRERFSGREKQVSDELYPVLHISDRPTLSQMIADAEAFVSEYVVPQDKDEAGFLRAFAAAEYKPGLLFSEWPETFEAAKQSPSARWKLLNLEKRTGSSNLLTPINR